MTSPSVGDIESRIAELETSPFAELTDPEVYLGMLQARHGQGDGDYEAWAAEYERRVDARVRERRARRAERRGEDP